MARATTNRPDFWRRFKASACPGCGGQNLTYSDYAGMCCNDCGSRPTLAEAYIYGLRLKREKALDAPAPAEVPS